jgi:hypothetical protein
VQVTNLNSVVGITYVPIEQPGRTVIWLRFHWFRLTRRTPERLGGLAPPTLNSEPLCESAKSSALPPPPREHPAETDLSAEVQKADRSWLGPGGMSSSLDDGCGRARRPRTTGSPHRREPGSNHRRRREAPRRPTMKFLLLSFLALLAALAECEVAGLLSGRLRAADTQMPKDLATGQPVEWPDQVIRASPPIRDAILGKQASGPSPDAAPLPTRSAVRKVPESAFAKSLVWQGVAIEEAGHTMWGASPIAAEGRFHLFAARWPEANVDPAWRQSSEIAHDIADRPEGPFRREEGLRRGTQVRASQGPVPQWPSRRAALDGSVSTSHLTGEPRAIHDRQPFQWRSPTVRRRPAILPGGGLSDVGCQPGSFRRESGGTGSPRHHGEQVGERNVPSVVVPNGSSIKSHWPNPSQLRSHFPGAEDLDWIDASNGARKSAMFATTSGNGGVVSDKAACCTNAFHWARRF